MTTEQKVTRKLRAILSADFQGYDLLMANEASNYKWKKQVLISFWGEDDDKDFSASECGFANLFYID